MTNLTADQHDLLTRIRDAGKDGYVIRQGELGDMLMFGLHGLATFGNAQERPQRAFITGKGRAFSFRVAA